MVVCSVFLQARSYELFVGGRQPFLRLYEKFRGMNGNGHRLSPCQRDGVFVKDVHGPSLHNPDLTRCLVKSELHC